MLASKAMQNFQYLFCIFQLKKKNVMTMVNRSGPGGQYEQEVSNDDIVNNSNKIVSIKKQKLMKHISKKNGEIVLRNAQKVKSQKGLLVTNDSIVLNLDRKSTVDFMSQEFHTCLFRLRQTGMLTINTKTKELTKNEIQYCIQNSQVVFVHNTNSNLIQDLCNHFTGYKIALLSGKLSTTDMYILIKYICQRKNYEQIAIHVIDTVMHRDSISLFVKAMALNDQQCIREVSADTKSFGSLGVAQLLVSLQTCTSVEVVIITISDASWLPIYGRCLNLLSTNSNIKEIRIYGALLGSPVISGLLQGITNGFPSLTFLEFGVAQDPNALVLADRVIDMAKRRILSGRLGLSVTLHN
jgi:hypothetical protein